MGFRLANTLVSFAAAALSLTSTRAQSPDKPTTHRNWGEMTTLASYHTDSKSYYNWKNIGGGLCHALNFKFLDKIDANMDVEAGAYYNSLRGVTPFAAVTFHKKLGKWPVYVGLGAGIFGYQDKAPPIKTVKNKPMPTDGVIPPSIHNGPITEENWQAPYFPGYTELYEDNRARGIGPTHYYPMAVPRVCVDLIDNKKMTMGFALQGGWLPNFGGLIGLSTYIYRKN